MELMKDELGGKIMKEFVAQTHKIYNCLMGDGHVDKKEKGTMKCKVNQEVKFRD